MQRSPANPGGGWDTTGRALGKALQDAGGAATVTYDNKGTGRLHAVFITALTNNPRRLYFSDVVENLGTNTAYLDPWGRAYRYNNLTDENGKGGARKDGRLNPLNTDFDLYSVGKDGETLPPAAAKGEPRRRRQGAQRPLQRPGERLRSMTRPVTAFFSGRLARRFFLMFVLSALVPLVLMVALSTTHVRGTLIEQGERRLAIDAKTYGAAAFEFDGSAKGLAAGVGVDAVTVSGGKLVLSFDARVTLGAVTAEDEDLVRFDGNVFTLFFDGSAHGVPAGLNLDGAHVLSSNRLAMSFDEGSSLPGVVFADEDVLEYDVLQDAWEVTYDGSAEHPGWDAPNLDAVALPTAKPLPPTSCGIGWELAFVMPLLLLAHRRRGSVR